MSEHQPRKSRQEIPAQPHEAALYAKWVIEALESGPAKPFRLADMDAAFAKGISRAKNPKLGH